MVEPLVQTMVAQAVTQALVPIAPLTEAQVVVVVAEMG